MSLSITKGKISGAAIRAVIYGTEGIGKSTLGAQIPASLVLDYEDGTGQIECSRVTISDWRAGEAAINSILADAQGFRSVIIDTADWCEKALIENMLKRSGKTSIEDYGYGKGYTALAEEFTRFLKKLDELIAKGINVVFVAHSTVKRQSPPDQTDGFDRYELKMTKQVAPLLKEWADMVLFVNYKIQVVEGSDGKLKAQGGKERVIFTTHSPAWDAKNRFGLPEEMPMTFASIAHLFGAVKPVPLGGSFVPPARIENNSAGAATPALSQAEPVAAAGSSRAKTIDPTPAAAIPPPPVTDNIPGLEEPAIAVPANIAAWLDANAAAVNAYLIRVSWLPAAKVWRDLPADKLTLIVTKPEKFARASSIPALK